MNAELREAIRQARDRQARERIARGPSLDVPPELRFARCEAITHWGKPCPWTAEPEKGFCEYHLKLRQDEEAEGDEEELDATLQQTVTRSGSSDLIDLERKRKVVSSTPRTESVLRAV